MNTSDEEVMGIVTKRGSTSVRTVLAQSRYPTGYTLSAIERLVKRREIHAEGDPRHEESILKTAYMAGLAERERQQERRGLS